MNDIDLVGGFLKLGRWIFKDGWITCNICGCQPYKEADHIDFDNLYSECPNCKAQMV